MFYFIFYEAKLFQPKHKESGISKKFAEFYEKTQYDPMAFVLIL